MAIAGKAKRDIAGILAAASMTLWVMGLGVGATVLYTPAPAMAQEEAIISEVRVEGTRRIDPDTVRSYAGIQPGSTEDARSLNAALRRLFDTDLFEDATIDLDGTVVTITVLENPIINRIALEGNDVISDEHILQFLEIRPRRVFTEKLALEGTALITEIYRQSGRYAASVEPKIIELSDRRVDLVFEIDEGPLVKITSVRFIGNEAFSDRALADVIRSREARWYALFAGQNDKYDESRLALDARQLTQFYLQNGYADMEVIRATGELLADRSGFALTFRIREGAQYTVRDVAVTSQLEGVNPDDILAVSTIDIGENYDVRALEETLIQMSDTLGESGYAFVELTPDIDLDADSQSMDITIDIGAAQRNYVEAINIRGNDRTLDSVIRRRFELVEGDSFNRRKLARSERNVVNLNYFNDVSVEVLRGSAPDQSVIDMEVEETSTGSFALSIGYSTFEKGLIGFGIRERNFLGTGRGVNANVRLSGRSTQFRTGITQPYLFDRDLTGSFSIFSDETRFTSVNIEEKGFDSNFGFSAADDYRHNIGYLLSDNTTTRRNRTGLSESGDEGSILVSEVSYTLSRDRRDNAIDPRSGYYWQIRESIAGLGGDAKYLRSILRGQYLVPFNFNNYVLGFDGEVGVIQGLDGERVTRSKRFSLGGTRLRGFDYAGIGPRDTGDNSAVGGNRYYRGSVNLTSSAGLPRDLGMRWTTFLDAGSLWETDYPANVRDPDKNSLRTGAGAGLLWDTVLGPLSFTWAYALDREDYDETKKFQFSFGGVF